MRSNFIKNPLAISTNTNPNTHLSLAVYQFAEKGYQYIELQTEHRAKLDYTDPKIVRELTLMQRDYGLKFSGHASYVKTDLASADELKRTDSVKTVKSEMRFFEAFGTKKVTVHTGRGNFATNFDPLCNSIKELMEYAEPLGITLCVETAGRDGFLLLSCEEYLKLINRTGCQLTLDLPHIMTTNPNHFWEVIDQLIPFAGNVHISDTFIPHHQHLPLGYGDFIDDHLISYLTEKGYQGNMVIDAADKGFNPEIYQNQGIAFVESLSNYLTLL